MSTKHEDKSIADLKFMISNKHAYSLEEVARAAAVLEVKRQEWKRNNLQVVNEVDNFIRKQNWLDFQVSQYDGYNLKVDGSTDFSYYHNLEIFFHDVFFVSVFFNGWKSDTQQSVFEIPVNEVELNQQYEIEQDYQLFIFRTEDYTNDVIIAANTISFNTDTVYYYNRENLLPGERIASFVKK